jgi:hypothetical protein
MSMATRLQKVTQSLSPLQRAVLVVRAQREGRESDPELLRFDDPQQRRAFDRYMGLGFVINRELGNASLVLHERVAAVEQSCRYYLLFSEAARQAEEQEGIAEPKGQFPSPPVRALCKDPYWEGLFRRQAMEERTRAQVLKRVLTFCTTMTRCA